MSYSYRICSPLLSTSSRHVLCHGLLQLLPGRKSSLNKIILSVSYSTMFTYICKQSGKAERHSEEEEMVHILNVAEDDMSQLDFKTTPLPHRKKKSSPNEALHSCASELVLALMLMCYNISYLRFFLGNIKV